MKLQKLSTLLTLLTLGIASSAYGLGTLATTSISNTGYLDYTTDDTTAAAGLATSNTVTATVTQVYNVAVAPDGTTAAPGQTTYTDNTTIAQNAVLTYTLTNTGNGPDTFLISTATQSGTVTPANIKYYLDNGTTPNVFDAGDTLITGATASVPADGTLKFFAVYPVPANTPGGTVYDITPKGQSVGDSTKTDINNLGRIIVKNVYDINFSATDAKNITTPGTAVYTQTLTNAGNAPLTAAKIVVTGAAVDSRAGFTQSYTATFGGFTGASATTPQAAIANAMLAGSLAPNAVLTLTTTVTANNALLSGDTDVLTLSASLTGITNDSANNNNVPFASAKTLTDTSTVIKGSAAIGKKQALCGTSGSTTPANCPDSVGAANTALTVKPGDYVVYYLLAQNTGTGNLYTIKVRDLLPKGVQIYSLGATSTATGPVLYSTDGTTWTSNATTLSVAAGTDTTNGGTVYAAVDTNSDGTITAADALPANKQILFRIKVKVNDGSAPVTTPVTDSQPVQ